MAGMLISNGSASSVTEASPKASRGRMARRVGSASAAKVLLRRSGDMASAAAPVAAGSVGRRLVTVVVTHPIHQIVVRPVLLAALGRAVEEEIRAEHVLVAA